jgi:hypothetical protein
MHREALSYTLAAMALICAVTAAAFQGGVVAALGAASAGLSSMAAVMGYSVARSAQAAPTAAPK